MKNQFRVVSRTTNVTKYEEPTPIIDEATGEQVKQEPVPVEGTTLFRVELSTVDINGVNSVVGHVYIEIDGFVDYTAEVKAQVEAKLAKLGLVEQTPVDSLDCAKQLRWSRIVAIRDGLESKGFEYLGKVFDSDERSIYRINTAAQAAMAAALSDVDMTIDWTTADNTVVTLTRDQIIGMPAALAANSNAIHQQAKQLRDALNMAGSYQEVEAIKWPGVEYEVHTAV